MTLTHIAEQLQQQVNAETAVVALAEAEVSTILYAAAVGKHTAFIQGKRSPAATSGLCGAVLESGQPALVCQPQTDVRIRQDLAEQLGITTALAVLVKHNGTLVGALMVLMNFYSPTAIAPVTKSETRHHLPISLAILSSVQHWVGER